jgi:hypothetical protein
MYSFDRMYEMVKRADSFASIQKDTIKEIHDLLDMFGSLSLRQLDLTEDLSNITSKLVDGNKTDTSGKENDFFYG